MEYSIPGIRRTHPVGHGYDQIPVDHCIYCRDPDFVISFVFVQPEGLRVAVPGKIGLCAACLALLDADDIDGVLERTRDSTFADFPDDAVLDLIRASRASLPD
jgi:hypothetical protein